MAEIMTKFRNVIRDVLHLAAPRTKSSIYLETCCDKQRHARRKTPNDTR